MERYPGITNRSPKNPDYVLMKERLLTFEDWSRDGIAIEGLAKAGFYATGNQDSVRCFYCGGGVKDWQQSDDPWIQHATVFPHCEYVKLCMGEDFINRAANMNEEDTQELNRRLAQHLVPDQLIEDLNCKAALLLIDKKYRQEDVEQAIQKAREKYGSRALRAHFIHEFLLESNTVTTPRNIHAVALSRQTNNTTVSNGPTEHQHLVGSRDFQSENLDAHDTEQDRLLEENRDLKDRIACKICMDKDACIVFIPCGHMVSCIECAQRQRTCAVCRAEIKETVRAYPA
ncbi:E3 ubiquitin-protein ligase XIAP-like [Mercenaria mercenaria]|uniref:E3 ubiquitin-protein ligase XIAP-like n=1 Tax=Mercenaria mercenaria TaxID=6596 RepID=UPI00234EA0BE|nr:E3 ubiquitin-protein ligase XIAP-like [Mercenaria mercenaria]